MSAAEAIYQEQESAVRDLIRRIENKEEYLSYSSLREFAISPRHFLRYKMKQKEQTPAMVFGSLVDCMILTEDQVEARFAVAPDVDRRTKEGKAKWEEFIQRAEGKEVVTADQYAAAEKIRDEVYRNEASAFLLDQTDNTQLPIEYEWEGWKWRGFVDADGPTIRWDLKMVSQFNPDKFFWKVKDMRYHWQGAGYTINAGARKDFYILAIDTDIYLPAVYKVSSNLLEMAQKEMREVMAGFRRCVMLDKWHEGYEFWGPERGLFHL